MRIAQTERTVTCVIVPADVQDMEAVEAQPHKTHTVHCGVGLLARASDPAPEQLQQAAEILNAGERVAMLVGQGALHATDEVIAVADELGAGVAKALLGKAAVPDDVPFCTGSIGLLGHEAELGHDAGRRHAADGRLELPLFGVPAQGRAGQSRPDRPRRANAEHPLPDGSGLEGDSKDTLEELLPMLERKEDRSWQEQIKRGRGGLVAADGRTGRAGRP